ncbi:hypothetical protein D3C78_653060 [compost metagenome]
MRAAAELFRRGVIYDLKIHKGGGMETIDTYPVSLRFMAMRKWLEAILLSLMASAGWIGVYTYKFGRWTLYTAYLSEESTFLIKLVFDGLPWRKKVKRDDQRPKADAANGRWRAGSI